MNKAEKTDLIDELKEIFSSANSFYLADCSTLTVEQTNKLRRNCFEQGIQLKVAKNKLIKKALERASEENGADYAEVIDTLHGPTALFLSESTKAPAELIKKFRETSERPILKAAFIDSAVYVGDDQLEALTQLKSREELIGGIITLLQSPMANVIGSLQSGGNTIGGLLKALEERG